MKAEAFNHEIKKGKIPPVCLLYGDEPYLIQETMDIIRKKLSGSQGESIDQEVFFGAETHAPAILQAARTISLFGSGKLVVVKNVERLADADQAILLDYVLSPVEQVTMVLVGQKPNMRKKLFAQLQKKWPAVRYYHPYDDRQAETWIRNFLHQKGFQIESDAARFLCEAHGRELQILKNELEKLILYKGKPGKINLIDVSESSGQSREYNAFELTDAVADRHAERALKIFHRLMEEGTHPLMVLGALAAKFRKLRVGKELEEEGRTDREILSNLKINYKGELFLKQLRGFHEGELEAFYPLLLSMDVAIKGGCSRPEQHMERMILRISRSPLRRGREAVHLSGEI